MSMKISVFIGLVAFVVIGCQQAPEASKETSVQADQFSESAERLLAVYEGLRSQLANDREVFAADFERVAQAARAAAASYSGDAAAHLEQLANAADEGASKASLELVVAQQAFGEVSRHLVSWLADQPELAEGRHVFECPMAKGYPKWVQQSESVSNPYMGQDMLTCGSPTVWQP